MLLFNGNLVIPTKVESFIKFIAAYNTLVSNPRAKLAGGRLLPNILLISKNIILLKFRLKIKLYLRLIF